MEEVKENLKKAFEWLVRSSANPEEFALTVRAGLPFLVLAGSLFGLKLEEGELLTGVHSFALAVTGLMTLYGALRKIVYTAKGK